MHRRWIVILGALIVQAVLGTVYAFSVFVSPLEQEFGWDRATTQWAFSIALATFALVMIPAGRLQDRVGPRKVGMIGGVLLGLSFLLGSVLVGPTRPWAFYLTYGVIGGAGIGFGYVCPIAAAVKWFPDKKGLVTGLAVAGFGAGALFFAGPASVLLLPPNAGQEPMGFLQILFVALGLEEGDGFGIGWRSFFVFHGLFAAAAVVAGSMLLRNPPAGWKPAGWEQSPAIARAQTELDWHQMLGRPLACMMWLTFIFGATSGLMAIGQWKPMMGAILGDRTFAPEWMGGFGRLVEPVGILAIFNALGRIFWGKISDLIDRPRAMMMMFLAQGMAFMLLVSAQSHFAIFLASAWVGLNFGGNFALFPSATSDYFGTKHFGINYGFIFTAYGVAGILGPAVGGVLFDATGQYVLPFVFAGILCFLAAACSVVVWALARRPLSAGVPPVVDPEPVEVIQPNPSVVPPKKREVVPAEPRVRSVWRGALLFLCAAFVAPASAQESTEAKPPPAQDPDLAARVLELEAEVSQLQERVGDGEDGTSLKPAVRSSIKLDIYGFVKLDAAYDDSRVSVGNFARWVFSEDPNSNDNEFSMTAKETRLGLAFSGPSEGTMQASGRIEVDFYGGTSENKPEPYLRHAYADWAWDQSRWSLLAGQTWDVISPRVMPTVNYTVGWWQGNIGYRRPQVRVTRRIDVSESLDVDAAFAATRTISGHLTPFAPPDGDTGSDAGFPTLQGRVGLVSGRDRVSEVGVSGHYGEEERDLDAAGTSERACTWSLNLDARVPLSERLTLQGELFTGENLDSYLGGIAQGVNEQTGQVIATSGGWLAASLKASEWWDVNLGLAMEDPRDRDLEAGNRSENHVYFANVFRHYGAHTSFAVELSYLETDYVDVASGDAVRAQFAFIYRF